LWQRRFGGDRSMVGRQLALNGEPYLVVGILPPDVLFPISEAEIAVPLAIESDPARSLSSVNSLRMIGRLADGVSAAQATGDLDRVTARLRDRNPKDNGGKLGTRLVPLMDQIVGSYRRMLWLLLGAVVAVLGTASINLANLLLTHAASRQHEFAVRVALGATRFHLVQQSLVEGGLLTLAGGMAGVAIAHVALAELARLVPADIPRMTHAAIDGRVIAFASLVSIATGLVFSLAPASFAARQSPRHGLGSAARVAGGTDLRRTRRRLLTLEIGCALMLLVTAALFIESLARLQAVSLGFNSQRVLTARLSLPPTRYRDPDAIARLHDTLAERIRAHAGVVAVAAVSVLPLSGNRSTTDFVIEGRPQPPADQHPQANYRIVGREYFRALDIPIEAGRSFDDYDRADSPLVAIVNHRLAEQHWPDGSPLGARLILEAGEAAARKLVIVGVAGNIRHTAVDQAADADIYVPIHQMPAIDVAAMANSMYFVLRSGREGRPSGGASDRSADADPRSVVAIVEDELRAIDRDIPVSNVRSMEQVLGRSLAPRRFVVLLLAAFAAAALALAALGVYGVTSQVAHQRHREIGIRVALGARPADIVRLVTTDALMPVMWGIAIGAVGSYAAGRLARSLLYDAAAVNPLTLIVVAAGLAGISIAAAVMPAIGAVRTDPRVTLATER
jgi:putative ABC transport system permease protein